MRPVLTSRRTMDNHSDPLRFDASACGNIARQLLRDGSDGRVAAVFKTSFYARSADGVACIGNESLVPCPLNVITNAPREVDWMASGLRVDAPWKASTDTIYVDRRFRFRLDGADIWQPKRAPRGWQRDDLERALAALLSLAEARMPEEGLGMFALPRSTPPSDRRVREMARSCVAGLRHWLATSLREPPGNAWERLPDVQSLVGLGPGLTPSGDDFLGGVMIALHALGLDEIKHRLWHSVRPSAREAGNAISLAHLSAASQGQGSAAIHRLLVALQTGKCSELGDHLDAIDRNGHTSGWDALAGLVAAIDVWLQIAERRRESTPYEVTA